MLLTQTCLLGELHYCRECDDNKKNNNNLKTSCVKQINVAINDGQKQNKRDRTDKTPP